MNRSILTAAITVTAATGVLAFQQQNAKQGFESAWERKTVVLKQTLHSIVYGDKTEGILMATPGGKPPYYEAFLGGNPLADSNPDRLLAKVNAKLGSTTSAQLLKYEPGTRLIVHQVHIARGFGKYNRRVIFDLYDEFARPGGGLARGDDPTTTLTIELPKNISSRFTEREEVESVIAQYLEPEP